MPKFIGKIGFVKTEETSPGVWRESSEEIKYTGDILRNTRHWETNQNVNSDLKVNNMISIIADQYCLKNFFSIKYVEWMGVKWEVTNIENSPPRLLITIGGVYNGN